MRIHVAALATVSLLVLAAPRSQGSQAALQGIPLGDLVRPTPAAEARPGVPSERNPTLTQLSPGLGGTSSMGSTTSSIGPNSGATTTLNTAGTTEGIGSTTGVPTSVVGSTPLTTPGLPPTSAYGATVGGVGTTNGSPATATGASSATTMGGLPTTNSTPTSNP